MTHGRDLVVADGVHRPAGTALQHALGEDHRQRDQDQAQEPQALQRPERHLEDDQRRGVAEGEAEQVERRHRPAVEAAGEVFGVEQDVLAPEDQRERGDAQVGALEAARDGAEQPAGDARDQHRRGRRPPRSAGPSR